MQPLELQITYTAEAQKSLYIVSKDFAGQRPPR